MRKEAQAGIHRREEQSTYVKQPRETLLGNRLLQTVRQGKEGSISPLLVSRIMRHAVGEMLEGTGTLHASDHPTEQEMLKEQGSQAPGGIWRLTARVRLQGASVRFLVLTLAHATPCAQDNHDLSPKWCYEIGLGGIFHHGIEEAFGWQHASEGNLDPLFQERPHPLLQTVPLSSLRHLQGQPAHPLWNGIGWLCCNLLQWKMPTILFPDEASEAIKHQALTEGEI